MPKFGETSHRLAWSAPTERRNGSSDRTSTLSMSGRTRKLTESNAMQIAPECAPCVYLQLTRTLEHRGVTDYLPIQRDVMLALGTNWDRYETPAIAIDEMYRVANRATHQTDAYTAEKTRANELAEHFWADHAVPVENLSQRLVYACAANIIDAGLDANPEYLFTQLEGAIEQGLGVDHSPIFWSRLPHKARLLYITDNAGEVVFDRELMRSLRYHGYHLSVLVRHHAFLNDVTRDDVHQVGLSQVANKILDLGDHFTLWAMRDDMLDMWAKEYDGFIIKGIANLESLSHRLLPRPALFLYRAKCPPAARVATAQWNDNVAWYQNR
ncbi:MAG: hypothetical protein C7B44_00550 [Sulfobacillus thermosulfidooxidans]|nr:MAG: hypothetical protein C7B44_00550 [Sulfobacillus thermosulfidooxidans]